MDAVSPPPPEAPARRRPGRPPRISRQLVVEAAAALRPDGLTLQAVAERLGVDRKAVSYYVSGREELLELVAARTLGAELGDLELPAGDWQAAVRGYARGTYEALLRQSSLSLVVTRLPGAATLAPTEALIGRLLDAGFDEERAATALGFVGRAVFAAARETLLADRHGQHPTVLELRRVLDQQPDAELPNLRRLLDRYLERGPDPRAAFERELDLVVTALAALRTAS